MTSFCGCGQEGFLSVCTIIEFPITSSHVKWARVKCTKNAQTSETVEYLN